MATTFMTSTLGAGARLRVQVAWGADIAAADTTWTWTDITGDVLQTGGRQIQIRQGRGDEAATSQPASCTLILDNRTGGYSLGAQSSNYPNVRRNTPIRVQVDPSASGASYSTVFQGYADGWSPAWDVTGDFAIVNLSASGVLRRLAQGDTPVVSSLRRGILADTSNIRGYWPCEDGQEAEQFASAIPGGRPMYISGPVKPAQNSDFACSLPLPTLGGGIMFARPPTYTSTGQTQLRWLQSMPSSGGTDSTAIAWILTTGTAAQWRVAYRTGGGMQIEAYDRSGTNILVQNVAFDVDGKQGQFGLQLTQNGANVDWSADFLVLGATASAGYSATLAGYTVGVVTQVQMNMDGGNTSTAVGHITLYDAITSESANITQLNAYNGEYTTPASTGRLARLCAENDNLAYQSFGDGSLLTQAADRMGPQRPESLLALLRECETADGGILIDGRSAGLTYVTRRYRRNRTADLTLDASLGQVSVDPVDDDQRTRNRVVATRKGGTTAIVEDVDGPLGTAAIGTYDSSLTVNTYSDDSAEHYAGWLVHMGTVGGYRHPRLELNFARDPSLVPSWLALWPGARIDITNISSVRTQHPTATVSLTLEGYTMSLDQFQWDVVANCSPFDPMRVIELATTSGDTGAYLGRLEPTTSTLTSSVSAGATSLSITTTGPLWTTDADDVPLTVEIAGIPITVTAISGASSPQTFTVTGATVTKALTAGASVTIYRPTVLAI